MLNADRLLKASFERYYCRAARLVTEVGRTLRGSYPSNIPAGCSAECLELFENLQRLVVETVPQGARRVQTRRYRTLGSERRGHKKLVRARSRPHTCCGSAQRRRPSGSEPHFPCEQFEPSEVTPETCSTRPGAFRTTSRENVFSPSLSSTTALNSRGNFQLEPS